MGAAPVAGRSLQVAGSEGEEVLLSRDRILGQRAEAKGNLSLKTLAMPLFLVKRTEAESDQNLRCSKA